MRLSCNGCRVLRKGCTADCSIRPCLQWIKSSKSQANATLFLAKFYGRAGLINLINAASPHLRPAAFKSLLHEACGRIVNPIFGSIGLLSSGSWHLCEAAVEAVLIGAPIKQVSTSESASMLNAGDIRHVAKSGTSCASVSDQLRKVKSRSRFKRTAQKPKPRAESTEFMARSGNEFDSSVSHDSASGVSEHKSLGGSGSGSVGGEADSTSVETVEASQLAKSHEQADHGDLELELTLGWGPVRTSIDFDGSDADTYKSPLGFLLPS